MPDLDSTARCALRKQGFEVEYRVQHEEMDFYFDEKKESVLVEVEDSARTAVYNVTKWQLLKCKHPDFGKIKLHVILGLGVGRYREVVKFAASGNTMVHIHELKSYDESELCDVLKQINPCRPSH